MGQQQQQRPTTERPSEPVGDVTHTVDHGRLATEDTAGVLDNIENTLAENAQVQPAAQPQRRGCGGGW